MEKAPAICVLVFGLMVQACLGEIEALRGPPKFDTNPKFSSSYIPAAMQIIAHDTELMKYVIKPPEGPSSTTTTTMKPTPPHRPAVYAPTRSPNYFRSRNGLESPRSRSLGSGENDIFDKAQKFIGNGYGNVLKLANGIDDEPLTLEEFQVLLFSKNFEDPDSRFRYDLLREKKVPPTKAYVTLLSLYDMLSKESKKLMLNTYAGYTNEVLKDLIEFSKSTSSHQLRETLNKVIEKGNTKQTTIITKIKELIADLDKENSYINEALKNIPPLVFAA